MNIWEQRANKEIEAAHHESKLALRKSLPEFLLKLVDILADSTDLTTARYNKKESTRVGKKHGKDRATSVDHTMDQMILEYHILRQVIFDVLESEAALSPVELEVIISSIEHAVNGAATQFSDKLNDLKEQSIKQKESSARELATEQRKLELIVSESPVGIA